MKIFSEKVYNVIKYICVIGLPAVSTFILAIGQIFDWQWTEACSMVFVAVETLLGALTCIDSVGYYSTDDDE